MTAQHIVELTEEEKCVVAALRDPTKRPILLAIKAGAELLEPIRVQELIHIVSRNSPSFLSSVLTYAVALENASFK